MDLVHSSVISTSGVLFLRILVQYGVHVFLWDVRYIEKVFKHLILTLDALIFIHKDCFISKEKPRLRADKIKQLLKQNPTDSSFTNPLTFEAQFNLDCDSNDAGPRAEVRSQQKFPVPQVGLPVPYPPPYGLFWYLLLFQLSWFKSWQ